MRESDDWRFGWPRYKRDLEGAWNAIEDLRNVALDNRRRLDGQDEDREMRLNWRQRMAATLVAVATIATAVHSWIN